MLKNSEGQVKKKRRKKKTRPVIKITSEHIEIVSVVGVYGILLLEAIWFLLTAVGVFDK